MVAMPFSGPFGLGELIAEAIRRLGAKPLLTGNNKTYGELKTILEEEQSDTYVECRQHCCPCLECVEKKYKESTDIRDACSETVAKAIEKFCKHLFGFIMVPERWGLGVRFAVRLMRACICGKTIVS